MIIILSYDDHYIIIQQKTHYKDDDDDGMLVTKGPMISHDDNFNDSLFSGLSVLEAPSLEGTIDFGGWAVVLAIPDWWPLALRAPAA